MIDALADHLREHGVRPTSRPPRPVMPRIPRLVRTVRVYQAMAHAQIVCWPICRALAERDAGERPREVPPLPMPPPLIWC